MPATLIGTFPLFVSTTFWETVGNPTAVSRKTSEPGVIESVLVAATPLPVSATDRGLAAVLSTMVSVAGRAPVAVGVKLTLTVHDAPGLRLLQDVLAT